MKIQVVCAMLVVLTLTQMPAWAECAWVLWAAELGGQPVAIAGYKSLADCERDKKAWTARDDSRLPAALDAPRQSIDAPAHVGAVPGAFRCLPDTVDPRGSTWSGR